LQLKNRAPEEEQEFEPMLDLAEVRLNGAESGTYEQFTYEQSLRHSGTFSVTWELVPGRGAFEKSQEKLLETAARAAKGGRVNALTITDNPGGNPALSAAMLGAEIKRLGIEPLVHLTCKDKNRNELESLLYGLERAGVRNLLVMTGDYPKGGYLGGPKPVFDLDPVTLVGLISELNQGKEVPTRIPTLKGSTRLKPTHFVPGVVASPFKALEAEQRGQYFKLKKKLEAGAQFVVSQLGFDARKFHELLQVVKMLGFGDVPVIGNIYLLPLGVAKLMNGNGLPGCVVPEKLLAEIESEATASDKGKSRRFERAAKMYALLKGMGFAGTHIAGNGMTYDDLEYVMGRGEDYSSNWPDLVHEFDFPQKFQQRFQKNDSWYYFERDHETGLNSEVPTAPGESPRAGIGYSALRAVHHAMFTKNRLLFRPMGALAKAVDGSAAEGAFTKLEHLVKGLTNDCLHCGDCALFDTAYLCPQSQCPKNQRNGPCGGSCEGYCEKYPGERKCIYVRAYERLKSHGEGASLGNGAVPPLNYALYQTSSWINFYLGRDHSAKKEAKEGIDKVERGPKQS
jgi:methylenetetrahydrofolate reductase (NADH)